MEIVLRVAFVLAVAGWAITLVPAFYAWNNLMFASDNMKGMELKTYETKMNRRFITLVVIFTISLFFSFVLGATTQLNYGGIFP